MDCKLDDKSGLQFFLYGIGESSICLKSLAHLF